MDFRPSPASLTSSTAIARATVPPSKQPTYTTAGTIYNPNTSQPLQPPTRRGRSFKWAQNTGTDLFPKSILNSLPLKTPGCPAPTFQQYSPLQQNYDRAISPLVEPNSPLAKMPYQRLPLQASNYNGTTQKRSEQDEENLGDENKKEDSDSDSEFGMDPLMGMTVKSLHNLASYPNPNQKRAQKALLRGMKQPTGGASDRAHPVAPSNVVRPIGSPAKRKISQRDLLGAVQLEYRVQPTTPVDTEQDPVTLSEDEVSSGSLGASSLTSREGYRTGVPTFSTRVLGTGAPRPLTAGPPGQRQYRPSTFESTWKALQTKSHSQKPDVGNSDMFGPTMMDSSSVENEGGASLSDVFTPLEDARTRSTSPYAQHGMDTKNFNLRALENQSPSISEEDSVKDSMERECQQSEGSTEPNIFAVSTWRDNSPEIRMKYIPGTDRLTVEAIKSRNDDNDRYWYAGSDFLGKTATEAVIDLRVKKLESNLGAIGDGRPLKAPNHYSPIGIQEAIRIPPEEHSKPIMNMTFATILRCLEEKWCRQILQKNEIPGK
ncbi:unnamed protein product [Clonostachys rosea]|uniref:SH3 domain-containing protein n=1 Tax=Bionectria ochroleuca TaxID=29856 RepID=A0ABY6USN2_BIOOC|nr:unnamed protein product [Clonostachys rosea]